MDAEPTLIAAATPATGLGVPELPAGHVRRSRLVGLLERAVACPLVLVSGAAGTGKTTLAAEWLRSADDPGAIAWVTFEDAEPGFWGPVLDALERLGVGVPVPGRGTDADARLGADRLRRLARLVGDAPGLLTVVLDGVELASAGLAREVDYLLRHTGGRLRLVFVTRVDPVLPLYRYRLADNLGEVRMADLAFTDAEAAELLDRVGVRLSGGAVHDLNDRVRGWAAGLRFAARALLGRDDAEQAAASVVAQAGDINEYLVGEVLDAQPPGVRQALLFTCVPDFLVPGLVEELVGSAAGRALGELARSNAFIEPVPDRPGSFRYYPFFRDLLRAQLGYESPQALADLHRRAAAWFEGQGLTDRAVGHLAATGAWEEVAGRIVDGLLVGRLLLEGRGGSLRRAAAGVPDHLEDPGSCLVRGAVALADGDRAGCAEELAAAWRAMSPGDGTLQTSVAALDAIRASRADDAATALAAAREAVRALQTRRPGAGMHYGPEVVALVQQSLGISLLRLGELARAREELTVAAGLDVARSFPRFRADCLGHLALVEALEGRPSSARRTAGEAVDLVADVSATDCSPAALVALACAALEQYELDEAREYIDAAAECGALRGDPVCRGLAAGVIAGLERSTGQLSSALSRLDVASTELRPTDPWLADHLRVAAAELSVASGRAELALDALDGMVRDEPAVAVVAAAAYAEQGRAEAVGSLLATVRDGDPALRARVSELLLEGALDRSLRLAEPEGLRRPFREAGPAVQRALSADARLLLENRWLHPSADNPTTDNTGIVDPLTPRELEVLGHLEELLTTEEIAEKMFVSVNTVRTHVRSILRKLGVSRRNAAVRKARELGMVRG